MQNFLVVIASYLFYGWWDWRFLILIVITSFCSFISGVLLHVYENNVSRRRVVSATNIILNLGILGLFKYFNFFTDNLQLLFESIGYQLDFITIDVILPVGISFYTFQALSYTIDVYRKRIQPTYNIIEFFAYISFFPQLVAGPIERATNLLPQFQKSRDFNYQKAVDGLRQMLWGFLKKIVVADNCAFIVNKYWDFYPDFSGISLVALAILFTFQIYCDFSGYSDIAIGCARLFGINLMRNFDFPYFSRSIPEFWRKWHISLMTWFRDYVYFPLGGSRCSKWKTIRNVFIVWSISGLWHGANWTFVCWGLYHASILAVYNMIGINTKYKSIVACGRYLPNLMEFFQIALTFSFVVIGWVIFRAEDISQAYEFILRMFSTLFESRHIGFEKSAIYVAIIMFFVEWLQRDKQHALQFSNFTPLNLRPVRWFIYVLLAVLIVCFRGHSQTFIYFQF
jgi:D-alanyl-lipoteichoic acid acyltransferase DltB (MBOAT superfamily)